uniref:Uncharacterized protein n=1 Tax=Rhipicephalus zambeziensis TaxID=60191 RepID=A0A224Y5I1_9ACAR
MKNNESLDHCWTSGLHLAAQLYFEALLRGFELFLQNASSFSLTAPQINVRFPATVCCTQLLSHIQQLRTRETMYQSKGITDPVAILMLVTDIHVLSHFASSLIVN